MEAPSKRWVSFRSRLTYAELCNPHIKRMVEILAGTEIVLLDEVIKDRRLTVDELGAYCHILMDQQPKGEDV